jgi:hypothetical protein
MGARRSAKEELRGEVKEGRREEVRKQGRQGQEERREGKMAREGERRRGRLQLWGDGWVGKELQAG